MTNDMKKAVFFIFPLLLYVSNTLCGQPYYFRHYQVENGLSHNSVMSVLQDQQGFLWLGTKDGLNRFDGYSFKVFRYDAEDTGSIGSNFIQTLYEQEGQLWVGTDNGLYKYKAKDEKFILLQQTLNNKVRAICKDQAGNLWFIAGYTLYRYRESKQLLQAYDSNKYFDATSICVTPDGTIWVSTNAGTINRYDAANDSFKKFDIFGQSAPTSSRWIEKIYSTGNQSILAGTQSQGMKVFDIPTATYQDVLPVDCKKSELYVRDFIQSDANEYWLATESGIFIYNLKTGKVTNLEKNYNDPYSISDNAVYSLYKDREGGIWAGTYFGGANYSPKQYTPFEKFFPKAGENAISGNAVREICQDQFGNVWIGTEDAGLNKMNPATGHFTSFQPSKEKNSLAHHNIHGLLAVGQELWIGTFEHGLDVMDIRSGKIIRHYTAGAAPGSLKSNFIYTMLQTHSGDILIGTALGLHRYNRKSDNFTLLSEFPEVFHYTILLEDHTGTIWAGTYRDGIYYYDPNTGKKGYLKHKDDIQNSLISNAVTDIYEDSRENLWFSTEGGLCKFVPQRKQFTRYTTGNGFPSNVIYQVLEDADKKLWISTSKGLVRFDPVSEEVKTFTKAQGLLSDQFNYNSSYKDQQDNLYFGSVNGMIRFNPRQFITNTYIPPICITGFQVYNLELPISKRSSPLTSSLTYTKKITLNHHQSSFSIDFAALSYTAPEMTAYTYKMQGLQEGWIYLKTNRRVYFTELAPGTYTFMVRASNSSGIWNDKVTSLMIEILPPFWASTWAYLIYAAIGMVCCYAGVRHYHHKAERKNKRKIKLLENQKEREIYEAKIEFFTNVAHEIRTPLTLIKGPLEKLINTTTGLPEIKESLTVMEKNTNRLLDLSNQLLDFRKTETKGFSLTFVSANISQLSEDIYSRFKHAAEERNLIFSMDLPEIPVIAYVDPEALTKIISNLLNNAVKYAENKVHIALFSAGAEHNFFVMEIKNDGLLIPAEARENIFTPFFRLKETEDTTGTGIGLPLSRSLAELHKGTLILKDPAKEFNIFVLTLPIHQEHEFNLYEEQPTETPDADHNQEETKGPMKPAILVVEDHKEMLEFVCGELQAEYLVFRAADGKKALEILSKECIQLIVSDVMMKIMDGFELCKQIKSNLEYSHIPVILLTAKNTLQAKIEGLESGADAYMDKPFSPEHLRVQIANLLANRHKIKEYFSSSPLAHIKSMAYSKADEHFLEELHEAINRNITDTDLNVEQLADIMNMSRTTLYRKIKAISDLTPNELINLARLKKAAELLTEGDYKIYEITNMVGYNSQTSFGRNFLKQFGMPPSEYSNQFKRMQT